MARHATHLWTRHKARELSRTATYKEPSEEAKRAREDFGYFCEYVLLKPPAAHHLVWDKYLVTGVDSENLKKIAGTNTDILAPRGAAKSTRIGAWVAWVIGHNPAIRIIYLSYSESVALSRSRLIKRLLERPRYKEVFPHILAGSRWSDSDWELNKSYAGVESAGIESDYTFYAAGITGSITSRRSDLIVCDDLIKSSKSIENPDVVQKIQDNWYEVIEPTLVPGGRIVDIGTRFTANDIHATDFTPQNGWQVIEQSAIITDPITGEERSYWGERFKLEQLQTIRERKPIIFSYQYQNKIIRITETSIDPNWIIRGAVPTDPEKFDSLVIGLDLSAGEKDVNDFTALVFGGRIGDKFYLLDLRRGRFPGNIDKLELMLSMLVDWEILGVEEVNFEISSDSGIERRKEKRYYPISTVPIILHAEDSQYQASLAADFRHYIINKFRIYNVIYRPAQTKGKSKLARLRGISGLFQNKMVVVNQYRAMQIMVDELTQFGATEHDDCADSAVYCLQGLSMRAKLDVA